jgi:hypothetical protein
MKIPARLRRRKLALVLALIAAPLALPSLASAGVPTITAVGHAQHHATVTWTLPAGTVTRGIEISDSPTVASDGAFLGDRVRSADAVAESATTYLSSQLLESGTYYVHVAGYVPGCDTCPSAEWSAVLPLVIPPFIQPVVQGSGQVTGPGGLTCASTACAAADVPAGTSVLTATPAAGWVVLAWQVEGIDAGDICDIATKTCTVTTSATRSSRVTVSFAPAKPTTVTFGVKAYACSHRVGVTNPRVGPAYDTSHPFLGTLTVLLKRPDGKAVTRKLKNVPGYFNSPDFFKLAPAKTYTVTLTYSGDEWRLTKTMSKKVKLGRC